MNKAKTKKVLFFGMELQVPTWARWLVMECDGSIICFEKKPRPGNFFWVVNITKVNTKTLDFVANDEIRDNISWDNSLVKVA